MARDNVGGDLKDFKKGKQKITSYSQKAHGLSSKPIFLQPSRKFLIAISFNVPVLYCLHHSSIVGSTFSPLHRTLCHRASGLWVPVSGLRSPVVTDASDGSGPWVGVMSRNRAMAESGACLRHLGDTVGRANLPDILNWHLIIPDIVNMLRGCDVKNIDIDKEKYWFQSWWYNQIYKFLTTKN